MSERPDATAQAPAEKSPWAPTESWEPELRPESTARVQPARRIHITKAEDFKGDPSRVIGHPSNPTTAMTDAMTHQPSGSAESSTE